jgi:hypothetical protein
MHSISHPQTHSQSHTTCHLTRGQQLLNYQPVLKSPTQSHQHIYTKSTQTQSHQQHHNPYAPAQNTHDMICCERDKLKHIYSCPIQLPLDWHSVAYSVLYMHISTTENWWINRELSRSQRGWDWWTCVAHAVALSFRCACISPLLFNVSSLWCVCCE